MSPHAYTEVQLVEQPAIALFVELGWQTVSAMEEIFQSPLYLAFMKVFMIVGRLRESVAKRVTALAETAQRASGSGRARSPLSLWDTKPVGEHMARARYRSLEARTADRLQLAFARLGDGEHD
jgi:hypothetical protein